VRLRPSHARQPDLEGRALCKARALGRHFPVVHLNQALDDRESDSETALRTIESAVAFHEQIEDSRQQVVHRVATEGSMREALKVFMPTIILSDFSMRGFSGLKALEIAREVVPDIPFGFEAHGNGRFILPKEPGETEPRGIPVSR